MHLGAGQWRVGRSLSSLYWLTLNYMYNTSYSGKVRPITMKVTIAEFIRHFGRFHDQARKEPVILTKHGRESVVVVSVETFEKLMQSNDPRRAYDIDETPPELRTMILDELDRFDTELANDHD